MCSNTFVEAFEEVQQLAPWFVNGNLYGLQQTHETLTHSIVKLRLRPTQNLQVVPLQIAQRANLALIGVRGLGRVLVLCPALVQIGQAFGWRLFPARRLQGGRRVCNPFVHLLAKLFCALLNLP